LNKIYGPPGAGDETAGTYHGSIGQIIE